LKASNRREFGASRVGQSGRTRFSFFRGESEKRTYLVWTQHTKKRKGWWGEFQWVTEGSGADLGGHVKFPTPHKEILVRAI